MKLLPVDSFWLPTFESLNNDDGEGKENGKKAVGLVGKTSTIPVGKCDSYTSTLQMNPPYSSLPLLHDYNRTRPCFSFYGGRKRK